MSFTAQVCVVLIASPGDTADARDVVEGAITSWNRDRARTERVVLVPLRWETDAVPEMGGDGQEVINRQLVDEADVVVALFHSRLGAPTARAASGTAEEIERARQRQAPVHVYFSAMPLPRSVDPDELVRLNEYRTDLQAQGLLGSYVSHDDLAAKVRTALERDVAALVEVTEAATVDPPPARALLRTRYEYDREPSVDNRGRTTMRTRRQRLVIENLGEGVARDVEIAVTAVGDGEPPIVHFDGPIERIVARSSVSVPLIVHSGVAAQWRVSLRWQEDDGPHADDQTVTPF